MIHKINKIISLLINKFLVLEEHKRYFLFATIVGCLMLIIVPPFQTPDDVAHYHRAVDISEGSITCHEGMIEIQKDRLELPNKMRVGEIAFDPTKSFDYRLLLEDYPQDDQQEKSLNPSTCGTAVVNYIAPATTLFVSSIFNNELLSYYLGRLTNLLLAILMTSLAIKLIPYGKKLVVLTGLLPLTISLYASYNYDWLIISSTLLFISYVIHVYYRGKLHKEDLLIIAALSLSLTTKYAIQPFLLIAFPLVTLIKENKNKVLFLIYLFFISFIIGATLFFTMSNADTYVVIEKVVPLDQLRLIITNPIFFIKVLFNTFYFGFYGFLAQGVGTLGWLDYNIGKTALLSILLAYVLSMLELVPKQYMKKRFFNYTMLLSAIITIILICLALYMFWNPVGSTTISGLQGRYFTISFFLISLFFANTKIFHLIREKIKIDTTFHTLILYILISVAYIFTFYSMLLRYLF